MSDTERDVKTTPTNQSDGRRAEVMFVEGMSYSPAPGSSTPVYSDCLVAPEVNFELFESLSAPYGRRWISFGFGAMVQVLGGALLIFLGFLLTPEIKQHVNRPEYVFLQLSPSMKQF